MSRAFVFGIFCSNCGHERQPASSNTAPFSRLAALQRLETDLQAQQLISKHIARCPCSIKSQRYIEKPASPSGFLEKIADSRSSWAQRWHWALEPQRRFSVCS